MLSSQKFLEVIASLRIKKVILRMRSAIRGMASHDLSNTKTRGAHISTLCMLAREKKREREEGAKKEEGRPTRAERGERKREKEA